MQTLATSRGDLPAQRAGRRACILVLASVARSLVNFRGPLLRSMVAAGCRVVACAPAPTPNIVAKLETMGVEFVEIPMSRAGLNPLRDLATFRAIRATIGEVRPDKVLAYTVKPVIYGLLAAKSCGIADCHALVTGLGYGFGRLNWRQRTIGAAVRQLYRVALRNARGVIFQNPDDRADFLSHGLLGKATSTSIVNGSGVDTGVFRPAALPPGPPVFLFVGRLLVDKGIREYLEAARALKARHSDARFVVAGEFDPNPNSLSREELQQRMEGGGIEYLGRLEDVRPAYAAATVFVLPSYREGTPRTVLEAMAMGRPVVTTDAPGCRETVVPGENGFLVPPRDAAALEAAMERFVVEPELAMRMGKASLAMVARKYDVRLVNVQMLRAMGLPIVEAAP